MDEQKFKSRKWLVCLWSMIMATLVSVGAIVLGILGHDVPTWFGSMAITCTGVSGAYIGINAYQKTHLVREEEKEDDD